MHAAMRTPSNGRSFAKRSRIWRSTGMERSDHSIRAFPRAARDASAIAWRGRARAAPLGSVMRAVLLAAERAAPVPYTASSQSGAKTDDWRMRVTEAARRAGTPPRLLRYREGPGLLPPAAAAPGRHRQYDDVDVTAARWAAAVEQRYG